jgi:hypothetical protein
MRPNHHGHRHCQYVCPQSCRAGAVVRFGPSSGAKRANTPCPAPWLVCCVPLNTCRIVKDVALCRGSYCILAAYCWAGLLSPSNSFGHAQVHQPHLSPTSQPRFVVDSGLVPWLSIRFKATLIFLTPHNTSMPASSVDTLTICGFYFLPLHAPCDNLLARRISILEPTSTTVASLGPHTFTRSNYGRVPVGQVDQG